MTDKNKSFASLILWYLPVLVVQLISGWITTASINPWYKSLQKAFWTPPDWVFGPVWSILYLFMAIAAWLVHNTDSPNKKKAYTLFFAQLFFNGLWSLLFFGLHTPGWALLNLGFLLFLVSWTMLVFYKIHKGAGLLFVPYLAWGGYAFTLNAVIWILNP